MSGDYSAFLADRHKSKVDQLERQQREAHEQMDRQRMAGRYSGLDHRADNIEREILRRVDHIHDENREMKEIIVQMHDHVKDLFDLVSEMRRELKEKPRPKELGPDLDMYKNKTKNYMSPEAKRYGKSLVEKLAEDYKPTFTPNAAQIRAQMDGISSSIGSNQYFGKWGGFSEAQTSPGPSKEEKIDTIEKLKKALEIKESSIKEEFGKYAWGSGPDEKRST